MIFIMSFLVALAFWGAERLIGIPWNFHPDAETYAVMSDVVSSNVLSSPIQLLNNGHYIFVSIFNSNIFLITLFNCLIFAFTNSLIWREIKVKTVSNKNILFYLILFGYLFNPYRVHLATTILKDTIIIFLLVYSLVSRKTILSSVLMLVYRVAAIIYFALLVPRKYIKYFIVFSILVILVFWDQLILHINNINDVEMQFRDFDQIPSFQELGLFGSFFRAIIWPIISITGLFIFVSPSIQYLPLAVGSFFVFLYCIKYINFKFIDLVMPLFVMGFFALLVTGYTTYFRYVFPVIVIMPIYLKFVTRYNKRSGN
jgi:hypothetical protein